MKSIVIKITATFILALSSLLSQQIEEVRISPDVNIRDVEPYIAVNPNNGDILSAYLHQVNSGIECSLIRNNVVVNRVNIDFAADPTIAFDGLGNGIHTNHPALVNSISSIPGWNFYANNSNVTETRTLPDYSHETQVAGVIAAQQTIYNNYIVKV